MENFFEGNLPGEAKTFKEIRMERETKEMEERLRKLFGMKPEELME